MRFAEWRFPELRSKNQSVLQFMVSRIVLTTRSVPWYAIGMAINLPPDLEKSIRRHLSSGQYKSAEDVLRAALDQFDEMDLVSLRHSADDERAGRLVSLESAADAIREKHGFDKPQ